MRARCAICLQMGERLADEFGIPRPIAVSQRDVPGWTRATLPLLNKHGVVGGYCARLACRVPCCVPAAYPR